LENPPEGVIFLLGATESYSLLSTVLSRVAKLEIPPFTEGDIAAALSRIYGEGYLKEDIAVCAAACGGNLGVAQDMLEGGGYKTLLDEAYSLALCPLSQLPTLVRKVGETKQKRQLLSMLRIVFRDALVCKIGKGEAAFLQAQRSRTQKIADRFLERALLYAQERLSKAESEVQFNAVFPQCLETLIASVLRENEK
jgi:DNA polymerase-3 subunit delta'